MIMDKFKKIHPALTAVLIMLTYILLANYSIIILVFGLLYFIVSNILILIENDTNGFKYLTLFMLMFYYIKGRVKKVRKDKGHGLYVVQTSHGFHIMRRGLILFTSLDRFHDMKNSTETIEIVINSLEHEKAIKMREKEEFKRADF